MREFHLQIATPDGVKFDGPAESLLIKCSEGDVEILAGHADLVSALGIGRARIKAEGKSRIASVSGGFISVSKDKAEVVATTFEYADEIDTKRAEAAKERAEAAMREAKNDAEIEHARLKLMRAINRIKVSEFK